MNWDAAGRPTDLKSIKKIMGQSVQGRKGEGSVLPAWVDNTYRALSADNAADVTLSGPKVNSFMLNLVGVVDEVTNDAWMANWAMVDAEKTFKGTPQKQADGSTVAGKSPGYKAFNALVRKAADILTKRTGELWTPSQVQEKLMDHLEARGRSRTQKMLASIPTSSSATSKKPASGSSSASTKPASETSPAS
jgi:hypothetical protein